MRRAFVTGATGMLGSYIVRGLLAERCEVRALVRHPAEARWLEARGVRLVPGDLFDGAAIRRGVEGCDAVFHAAAVIGPQIEWEPFRAGNVDGTRRVLDACADTGARLVHVSSTAVYGDTRCVQATVDEDMALPVLPERDAYGRSKQEAERLVKDAHERGRAWCTIVRPPTMYGERDRQFVPRVVVMLTRGLFPLIGGGRTTLSAVHAGAVAAGAILAACSDAAGGRAYNLTDDFPLTAADLVRFAGEGLQRRIIAPTISMGAGRVFFRGISLGVRLIGRPELSAHAMGSYEWLTHDNPYRAHRARRELHWNPTVTPDVGVPQAFRWWKQSRETSRSRSVRHA